MLAGILLYLFAILPVIDIHYRVTCLLTNDRFNDFLVAIGTGVFASALTALLIDMSNEKRLNKLHASIKEKLLYDMLVNLRYWTNFEDEVQRFEWKLNSEYMEKIIAVVQRANDFGLPYMSLEEYDTIAMILGQLKGMQDTAIQLQEKVRYKEYKECYKELIYSNSEIDNMVLAYESGKRLEKLFGIDERVAYDIAISVILFNSSMKAVKGKLELFENIKTDSV